MGYTHYWAIDIKRGETAKTELKYQKAIIAIQKAVKLYQRTVDDESRLSGYTAHTKVGAYKGVKINGKQDLSHEDFILREHAKENTSDFCKTAMKPYDTAVVASLILLKHYLGDSVEVSSDGNAADWLAGLRLAKAVCPSAKIPSSIRGVALKALVS